MLQRVKDLRMGEQMREPTCHFTLRGDNHSLTIQRQVLSSSEIP